MSKQRPLRTLFIGVLVLWSCLALTACSEQPQTAKPEAEKAAATPAEQEKIVWKLAMTWPTNFPIFGDAV
ncbi:MAG: hypothetical protein JRE16_03575, partial [Deltaproteobacteria bacterium]|nr:hypothetical protein [Deltaproteobacteria bacterium]